MFVLSTRVFLPCERNAELQTPLLALGDAGDTTQHLQHNRYPCWAKKPLKNLKKMKKILKKFKKFKSTSAGQNLLVYINITLKTTAQVVLELPGWSSSPFPLQERKCPWEISKAMH